MDEHNTESGTSTVTENILASSDTSSNDPTDGNGQSDAGQNGDRDSNGNSGAIGQVQEKIAPVAGQIRDAVKPVVEQAQQKTGEIVGQVQQQVQQNAVSRLDQQKEQAAGGLGSVADGLRQTSQQLRDNGQGVVPQYAAQYGETAAQQIEKVSTYLSEHDVNQLVGDVESFARREPALFVAGAFVLGLMGARFLRTTAPASTSSPSGSNFSGSGSTSNGTSNTGSASSGSTGSGSNGVISADFEAAPTADYSSFAE